MINAFLLTIMRGQSFELDIIACLSQLALVIVGFEFVDDTNIINVAKSLNTRGEEVLAQHQQEVDRWEGTLNATRGVLQPDKSYWYMTDYKHIRNVWLYKSIKQLHRTIIVKVANETRQTILRLEPKQATETLDIFVSTDENSKDHIENPLKKLDKWLNFSEH